MRGILTLALKDLLLIWRDKFGLFWILGFPVIYAVFFGSVLGGGHGDGSGATSIALTDEDQTEFSQEFTARLASSEALSVTPMTREEGREAVRLGRQAAQVVLPTGFGESLGFGGQEEGGLEIAIDPSRRAEGAYLQGILMSTTFEMITDRFMDPERAREWLPDLRRDVEEAPEIPGLQRDVLLQFYDALDKFLGDIDPDIYQSGPALQGPRVEAVSVTRDPSGPQSAYEIMFPVAMLWGLMGCTAGFAISLVRERSRGTLLRLRVSPLSRAQILAGKGLACFLACSAVIVMLLALGRFLFNIRFENPPAFALALACTSLAFVGIMMLLSTLGRTEEAVGGSSWAVLLLFGMVGGAMIPRFVMPLWMQALSNFSPISWGIRAMEGATWRGFTLVELAPACGVLLLFGAVCFSLGVAILSRHET
ncbi:ABC transporter permease [Candidatus Sumerlaeota bacterium]|nr:ABC transporter permease [Candidatus Sumerlaeota bacterium]